jgi:hypothetical protein
LEGIGLQLFKVVPPLKDLVAKLSEMNIYSWLQSAETILSNIKRSLRRMTILCVQCSLGVHTPTDSYEDEAFVRRLFCSFKEKYSPEASEFVARILMKNTAEADYPTFSSLQFSKSGELKVKKGNRYFWMREMRERWGLSRQVVGGLIGGQGEGEGYNMDDGEHVMVVNETRQANRRVRQVVSADGFNTVPDTVRFVTNIKDSLAPKPLKPNSITKLIIEDKRPKGSLSSAILCETLKVKEEGSWMDEEEYFKRETAYLLLDDGMDEEESRRGSDYCEEDGRAMEKGEGRRWAGGNGKEGEGNGRGEEQEKGRRDEAGEGDRLESIEEENYESSGQTQPWQATQGNPVANTVPLSQYLRSNINTSNTGHIGSKQAMLAESPYSSKVTIDQPLDKDYQQIQQSLLDYKQPTATVFPSNPSKRLSSINFIQKPQGATQHRPSMANNQPFPSPVSAINRRDTLSSVRQNQGQETDRSHLNESIVDNQLFFPLKTAGKKADVKNQRLNAERVKKEIDDRCLLIEVLQTEEMKNKTVLPAYFKDEDYYDPKCVGFKGTIRDYRVNGTMKAERQIQAVESRSVPKRSIWGQKGEAREGVSIVRKLERESSTEREAREYVRMRREEQSQSRERKKIN